jgi:hypothetical protein
MNRRASLLSAALLAGALTGGAQDFIDGPKLLGTGAIGSASQGLSVALSSDGSTALVGGWGDDSQTGAAWVFTRTKGRWSQQAKLVGFLTNGKSYQGTSVALSSDGSTALVGGEIDGNHLGAVWAFTRTNGAWSGGVKLVPNNASTGAEFGAAVSLSADGATALIGGPGDEVGGVQAGAAWIYTHSGSSWTQGTKLIGSVNGVGVVGAQGTSVALSADGTTALVGGPTALANDGSVWVFVLSNGSWAFQQRLFASSADESGTGQFGKSVAIAANGSTAIVGGPQDASGAGAAWVWVRSGGSWSIQGSKLVGLGATTFAQFGGAVAMSADGNTVIVGGPQDGTSKGAAWIFERSAGMWSPQGTKRVGSALVGMANVGFSAALSANGGTALIGAPLDSSSAGAAWVYMRACVGPPGDADGNGTLDVADVFYTINFLFAGGPAPQCP